jgi:hypothetical protein
MHRTLDFWPNQPGRNETGTLDCVVFTHAEIQKSTEGSCLMRLLVLEKIRISQNSHQPNWAKIAKKLH